MTRTDMDVVKQQADCVCALMGKCFPTMPVVEVSGLVESAAKVEIETTAVIPD